MTSHVGSTGRSLRLVAVTVTVVFAAYLVQSGARLFEPTIGPLPTTEPWWRIGHVMAGAVLLGSGLGALMVTTLWRPGVLAVAAAMAWFAPDLARLATGPLPARAAAVALGVLLLPLLLHLLTVLLSTLAAEAPIRRRTQIILDGVATVAAGMVLVTYSPLHDAGCTEACNFPRGMLAVDGTARALLRDAAGLVNVVAGGLLALASARWWLSARPTPGWALAVVVGGIVVGLAGATVGLIRLEPQLQRLAFAGIDGAWILLPLLSAGTVALAGGLAWRTAELLLAPRRIRRLADRLVVDPPVGTLEASLAAALDDPALRVGYLTDLSRTLAADGSEVDLDGASGRTVTSLMREGVAIALVRHRSDVSPDALRDAFGPSLLLALDYERLRALSLSTLRELQSSRARIVELGDAERRRIERDLHDGAQQRLLAIAFDLRLASATARRDGRPALAAGLDDAASQALALVEELRQLCRGIHPQVLSQAGLAAALAALADDSAIPVEVSVALEERPSLAVETAAYELVVDALAQGMARGAPAVTVQISREADVIAVQTEDGAPGEPDMHVRLADRIGALGGVIAAGASERGGYLRAVLPCA